MALSRLLEALLACTAVSASRYADKAAQGEPSGCLADDADACGAAVACARFAPWSAPHFGCLRRELLLDSGEPRPGARYVVMRQAGFGMANSIRGSVNGGVLIAAATSRRLALDWPDLERNFAAAPPLRLAFDRAPEPGEWWLDARNTTFWTETAVGKVEGVEDVYLDRLRGPSSPTFAISSSGGTSLPGSDATRACAARLFGAACAARRACVLGNHGAVPADAPWTLEALAEDLEDVPCAVLTARDAGAFHYYVGAARDRDTDEAAVPFAAFASQRDPRVYLQAPLFVSTDYRRPPASAPGLGPRLARLATDAFDALAPFRAAAALGPWARTQLFVSRTGATSPLHFDQYANLYLQLAGHKRVSRTGCDIPDFKGSDLGRFPLVSADFWTSDHLLERSRSIDAFSGTRARGTLMKRT